MKWKEVAFWIVALGVVILSSSAFASDIVHPVYVEENSKQAIESVKADIREGRMAHRTGIVMGFIIWRGVQEMRNAGANEEADRIWREWKQGGIEQRVMFTLQSSRNLGDWPPISVWFSATYLVMETVLGKLTMQMLHMDDLYIMNHAIPVVFDACNPLYDKNEFRLHFGPMAGVLIYWSVWGGCVAGTSGIGFPLCGVAGSVSESVFIWIGAKPLSNATYSLFCGSGRQVH